MTITITSTEKLHGHPRFTDLVIEEMELHSAKNRDYAREGASLGNFYRVARILDTTPACLALIYMMKQVDAAAQMLINGYEGEVEGLKDRLRDIGVYAKLIQILKEEEHGRE